MIGSLYSQEWLFFNGELWGKCKWLLFLSALCLGLVYVSFIQNPEAQGKFLKAVVEALQAKGLLGLREKSSFILAEKIFLNNLQATFLFTVLGFIPFFLGPILFVLVTSTLLGGTLAASVANGFGVWPFLKLTVPHGVFELFAVFYGASLGAYFSKETTKKLLFAGRGDSRPFVDMVKQIVKSYPLIIIPFLAVAALIEAFLTPLLK
jgi:uncharacterized membrane protein SpoIIM required for sporulation